MQLERELAARGVHRAARRRIVLEYEDHIACDPQSSDRLGDPAELASAFADELATDEVRGAAGRAFIALSFAALALLVSQLWIGRAGSYPGFDQGRSLALSIPAILGMLLGPQVAIVGGSLALLRALRRRHEPVLSAGEVALIRRRSEVALGGGLATSGGLLLYMVNFSGALPAWWLGIVGFLSMVATTALLTVGARLMRSRSIFVKAAGPAGDVFDDLSVLRPLSGRPWLLCGVASLAVAGAFTIVTGLAERSIAEGIERGLFEGFAAVAGFALLGRAVGLRRQD